MKVVNTVQEISLRSRFSKWKVVVHKLQDGLVLPKWSSVKQGDSEHMLHEQHPTPLPFSLPLLLLGLVALLASTQSPPFSVSAGRSQKTAHYHVLPLYVEVVCFLLVWFLSGEAWRSDAQDL